VLLLATRALGVFQDAGGLAQVLCLAIAQVVRQVSWVCYSEWMSMSMCMYVYVYVYGGLATYMCRVCVVASHHLCAHASCAHMYRV